MLNRREADGPDVAVKCGGSMDLDDSDVVLICVQFEVPMYPYLRHHEIQCSRLLGCSEIVLAESHRNIARFEPVKVRRRDNCNSFPQSNCSFRNWLRQSKRVSRVRISDKDNKEIYSRKHYKV